MRFQAEDENRQVRGYAPAAHDAWRRMQAVAQAGDTATVVHVVTTLPGPPRPRDELGTLILAGCPLADVGDHEWAAGVVSVG